MAIDDEAPLLHNADRVTTGEHQAGENTPLLSRLDANHRYDGPEDNGSGLHSPAATSLRSIKDREAPPKKTKIPWAIITAIVLLVVSAVAIALGVYVAPTAVEQYAKEAIVIEPTNLSIESFTTNGVQARIRANFKLDASKVRDDYIRNIGRAGTWMVRTIESDESVIKIYLPEYDNILLGTVAVPNLLVNIRNGETTRIDFVAGITAGDVNGIKRIANDWLEGRLGQLRVQGEANIALKSGIFSLGTTTIVESMVLEGDNIPTIPAYNITNLTLHEASSPVGVHGLEAYASLLVFNKYPLRLQVPPIRFDILVPNCKIDQPLLGLADVVTNTVQVEPAQEIPVQIGGLITNISNTLRTPCSSNRPSPLDVLLCKYIHGDDINVFVRGSSKSADDTPAWITDIISGFTVPVPFPGHKFDDAIRNFTLDKVHFGLPNPFADPGTPEADYRVSGNIDVVASMPKEMNFAMNVSQVRANADVFYKGNKLGYLDLYKWQSASSRKIDATSTEGPGLRIISQIKEAPLRITNDDVFSDMMSEYLIGGKTLILAIKALVDVKVETVLGEFIIRELPGEGNVPVKASHNNGNFTQFLPKISDLEIVSTSPSSLTIQARMNFTNPTEYSAGIPYASIHIENNGSVIAEGIVKNISVVPGENTNIIAFAKWDPLSLGSHEGVLVGRELLSQYISGYNTTLTMRTHTGSIPSQPGLGLALSKYNITIPTPHLLTPEVPPDDDVDDPLHDPNEASRKPNFIRSTTFHLLSSTAQFSLLSPLHDTSKYHTIYIDSIRGTAFYNRTEAIGTIDYGYPFKVEPGETSSPRIPVSWSLGSVGYEKVRKALGGKLMLDAVADVEVRVGQWSEKVWFQGGGIGATVRL